MLADITARGCAMKLMVMVEIYVVRIVRPRRVRREVHDVVVCLWRDVRSNFIAHDHISLVGTR